METVESDMMQQGCQFAYYMAETSKFLLPQRRNRVYGVVSENEQHPEKMTADYKRAMSLFESFAKWGCPKDFSPMAVYQIRVPQVFYSSFLKRGLGHPNFGHPYFETCPYTKIYIYIYMYRYICIIFCCGYIPMSVLFVSPNPELCFLKNSIISLVHYCMGIVSPQSFGCLLLCTHIEKALGACYCAHSYREIR